MRITFRRIPFLSFIPLLILAISAACLKSPSEPAIQEPASITLSSYSIVLTSIGQRVLINATVLDQDSRVIADATIFFRSGNEKIATVGNSGLVTAVSMGSTQITVTSGYATASATVTVMQEAGSITISPPIGNADDGRRDRTVDGRSGRRRQDGHPGRGGGVVQQ